MSKHVVIAVTDKLTRRLKWNEKPSTASHSWCLGEFSWNEAHAAFDALQEAEKPEGVRWFAVRDTSDPEWAGLPRVTYGHRQTEAEALIAPLARIATLAAQKHRKKLISESIAWAIREKGQGTFDALKKAVSADLAVRGVDLRDWELQDEVKARVLVGRCLHGCGKAWWMPKKQGPLGTAKCATCGASLYQTTTVLRKPFYRLPAPEEGTS